MCQQIEKAVSFLIFKRSIVGPITFIEGEKHDQLAQSGEGGKWNCGVWSHYAPQSTAICIHYRQ
jgi:hypothetical protein